jgi:hypothetical protein
MPGKVLLKTKMGLPKLPRRPVGRRVPFAIVSHTILSESSIPDKAHCSAIRSVNWMT